MSLSTITAKYKASDVGRVYFKHDVPFSM